MGMDWEAFYENADYDRCIYLGGDAMVECLDRFLQRFGPFDDVSSVGCGPAVVLFELADRHPEIEFRGLDASSTVVADNAELADDRGLDNLDFAVDRLPDLETARRFDLVYSAATLFFVEDAEAAVASLFDRVRPGGYLVVNYPNRYSRARWPEEFEDERKREAFELVFEGRNLLSYDRIRDVCGTTPRNYWSAVGAASADFATRDRPMVYVRKPADVE